MTDDLIFWKATGCLVVCYWMLRAWQWRKARQASNNDPWSGVEHR